MRIKIVERIEEKRLVLDKIEIEKIAFTEPYLFRKSSIRVPHFS